MLLDPGLPAEAPPFLTFSGDLERLREAQPHLPPELAPFRVLGMWNTEGRGLR
ncbi:MAG: hypothetical protein AB7N76_00370 [Planctomycetota bacterium]